MVHKTGLPLQLPPIQLRLTFGKIVRQICLACRYPPPLFTLLLRYQLRDQLLTNLAKCARPRPGVYLQRWPELSKGVLHTPVMYSCRKLPTNSVAISLKMASDAHIINKSHHSPVISPKAELASLSHHFMIFGSDGSYSGIPGRLMRILSHLIGFKLMAGFPLANSSHQ